MSLPERTPELLAELRFALEEGNAESPPVGLLERVLRGARETRQPGRPVDAPQSTSGAQTFAGAVASMDTLLAGLTEADWSSPALRDLDVQGLVGHLIGVEDAFVTTLLQDVRDEGSDHIASTQPYALAQVGRAPAATLREWRILTSRAMELVSARSLDGPVSFYGMTALLDQMLVVRAFEMWTHEEDVRRATDRGLNPPEPGVLSRMAELAVSFLPAGMARAGASLGGQAVRLVLTGPAGGTWTVATDDNTARSAGAIVVVDTAAFCRVAGNRLVPSDSGAWIEGDEQLAAGLLVGATALALD